MWKAVKYLLVLGVLLFCVGLLSLCVHGLPHNLTRKLEKALQVPDTTVTLKRVKLSPLEGIVATELRCYHRGDVGAPFLSAEKVILLPRLFFTPEGMFGMRRIEIKDARVIVPPEFQLEVERPFILDNLNAQVVFQKADVLLVKNLTADVDGFDVTGEGTIRLSSPTPDPGAAAKPQTSSAKLKRYAVQPELAEKFLAGLRHYREVNFKQPPKLSLNFNLDQDNSLNNRVRLRLQLAEFDRQEIFFRNVSIWAWLSGNDVSGRLEIGDVSGKGVALEQISGNWAIVEGKAIALKKMESFLLADEKRGPVSLDCKYDWQADILQGEAQARFDITSLVPTLRQLGFPGVAEQLSHFEFVKLPPYINLEFSGSLLHKPDVAVTGILQANHGRYKTVSVTLAQSVFTAKITADEVVLSFDPLAVTSYGGATQGRLTLLPRESLSSFDAISTSNPHLLAQMAHSSIVKILAPFHVDGATVTRGAGQIDFDGVERDAIEAHLDYQRVGWKSLTADYCDFSLNIAADTVELHDIAGSMFGGKFGGSACFSLSDEAEFPDCFEAQLKVLNMNFNTLAHAWLKGERSASYQGHLSLDLCLSGLMDISEFDHLTGQGQVLISDGSIFKIPIFGGLSDLLGKLVPGLNSVMRQTDARAFFTIRDGKITSDEILIEGNVFSLRAAGSYYLDGRLDFRAQLVFLRQESLPAKVLRIITLPVSKIIEFELKGTLSEPQWRLAHVPRDFLFFLKDKDESNP